ncbi:MAG: pyridoxamine 5'-phosphate oxidase [Limisphaerales bacterium]
MQTTLNEAPAERTNLESMRVEYTATGLDENGLAPDPLNQFASWFEEACKAGVLEPNAVVLATVNGEGQPTTRTVLIKHFDQRGFVFFTNLESRKARQIAENSRVSILFPWLALQRQVIVEGAAEKLSKLEALQYFMRRPRGSQIAAAVSKQSSVVSSRKLLEMEYEKLKQKVSNGQIPFPSSWGGFRVVPTEIEFWQGRGNRLHDRFRYYSESENNWRIERLSP